MKTETMLKRVLLLVAAMAAVVPVFVRADAGEKTEQVNVEGIKEKYWARGNETEMGVVQNRLYSKAYKFELGAFGGIAATDPFLSVKNIGGSLGFHFSEYLALHFVGWKNYVGPSSALLTFEETIQGTTNYNAPKYFLGGEVAGSILYGKLSLVGKAIIYYDLHLTAGAGTTATMSGNYFTPYGGIGQQVYLSKYFSLKVDYRLMRYSETIIERVITTKIGKPVGTRTNWTNEVTLGVTLLWGPGK
ncbi:MAG: hypothetical protein A2583_09865 [Bdellovibrionales bacterium RIFOXYD1_FULL_53_11]|nr:MAG: hypothetical protein A2583_09865 [Bdellovibrionales bacterium RIFOXYD1_FULL_53_11]